MGGHVEDEEAEAEHSHEIQEGRLENTARREIIDAIQHMGRVEVGLAAVNTGAALPPARAAVEALQRAFGTNRYFLRTLARTKPRRPVTPPDGRAIQDASDWRRELYPPAADPAVDAARTTLLAQLLELTPGISRRCTATASAGRHWQRKRWRSIRQSKIGSSVSTGCCNALTDGSEKEGRGRYSRSRRSRRWRRDDRAPRCAPRYPIERQRLRSAWAAERPYDDVPAALRADA